MLMPLKLSAPFRGSRASLTTGAKTINCYLVPGASPSGAVAPTGVLSAPVAAPMLYNEDDIGTAARGVHGMTVVDSPVYGHRLYVVLGGNQFASIDLADHDVFGDRGAATGDPSDAPDEVAFTTQPDDFLTGRTPIVSDGRRTLWIQGRRVWAWDNGKMGGAGLVTVAAPTPADQGATLPDEEWVDIAWIDGYFILAARSGQFFHSLLSQVNFDQLDFASASARPDPIVGVAVLNRRLYLFGSNSVEQWYNAGGRDFAFVRDNSFVAEIGAASRDAIAVNEVAIVFLATNGIVYAVAGTSYNRQSCEEVEADIARSHTHLATAFTSTIEGHLFYHLTLTFPDNTRKAWVLDLSTGFWHEHHYTDAQCSARVGRQVLIGGRTRSVIWDWRRRDNGGQLMSVVAPWLYAGPHRFRISSLAVTQGGTANGTIQLHVRESPSAPPRILPSQPLPASHGGLVRWDSPVDVVYDRVQLTLQINAERDALELDQIFIRIQGGLD